MADFFFLQSKHFGYNCITNSVPLPIEPMAQKLQVDIGYRQILHIALPISFALLVPQFNFVINNIFLCNLSEEALATASITGVYYLIFSGIGYGLNNGL